MTWGAVHVRAGAGIGIALLAPHGVAPAAEWTIEPGARLQLLAETNPRLVARGAAGSEDAQALALGADLLARRRTELGSFDLAAGISQRRYQQDSALDRLDADLELTLGKRRERLSWQVRARAARDTTLTSELGLSGVTGMKYRHEVLGGSFNSSWAVSERLAVEAGASVQFDSYPGRAQGGLVDYRYRAAQFGGSYALDELSKLTLSAHQGELAASQGGFESTDSSLQLQYGFQPSERFGLSVFAGPAWVKGPRGRERGESFGTTLSRSGKRMTTTLSAQRGIAPTGRGILTERDDATLRVSLPMGERVNGSVGVSYLRSKDILSDFSFELRSVRYRRATVGLDWQVLRHWSAALSAGYSDQIVRGLVSDARGFELQAGFTWSGGAHVW